MNWENLYYFSLINIKSSKFSGNARKRDTWLKTASSQTCAGQISITDLTYFTLIGRSYVQRYPENTGISLKINWHGCGWSKALEGGGGGQFYPPLFCDISSNSERKLNFSGFSNQLIPRIYFKSWEFIPTAWFLRHTA